MRRGRFMVYQRIRWIKKGQTLSFYFLRFFNDFSSNRPHGAWSRGVNNLRTNTRFPTTYYTRFPTRFITSFKSRRFFRQMFSHFLFFRRILRRRNTIRFSKIMIKNPTISFSQHIRIQGCNFRIHPNDSYRSRSTILMLPPMLTRSSKN